MSKGKRKREKGFDEINKATAMTARFVHEKVLEITATLSKGKLLDIPCGQGALGERLRAQGFDIYCGDIDPEWYRIEGGISIGWILTAIFLTKTVVLTGSPVWRGLNIWKIHTS